MKLNKVTIEFTEETFAQIRQVYSSYIANARMLRQPVLSFENWLKLILMGALQPDLLRLETGMLGSPTEPETRSVPEPVTESEPEPHIGSRIPPTKKKD